MSLKKIKEGCWVDENDPYFSLNEWFNINLKKIVYYVTNGEGCIQVTEDAPIAEDELYDRIFLPGRKAIEALKN